jgi:hypothetical protein
MSAPTFRHLQLKMSAPTLFSPLETQLNSMQCINISQKHNHEKIQNVGTYSSKCRHRQLKISAPTAQNVGTYTFLTLGNSLNKYAVH